MDKNFWLERWEKNNITFHLQTVNPALIKYYHSFKLKKKSKIFIPLCGKSLDIKWLASNNLIVTGVELSELAVVQLFSELELIPDISIIGDYKLFSAKNILIYVGDFFNLTPSMVGNIDLIYDRAALVALPNEMRKKYTEHLMNITRCAEQLLVTYNYSQTDLDGPPFSISRDEIELYYAKVYLIKILESIKLPNKLKNKYPAKEEIWHLKLK